MTGRFPGVLRELALTAGAVAGVLCVVFALLGATVGVRPLVFTSGSMAPAIKTGDLAVTRPVPLPDLASGDVVSVIDARGLRVTHRVIEVDTARHQLRLKGDANAVADPLPYAVEQVDRVLLSVPAAGYVLTWLTSPAATMLLGAYVMFLLCVLRPRRAVAAGLVIVVGLGAGVASPVQPTSAAWTDAVPVSGVSLAAYTVPKPVITGCAVSLLSVTVTWTAVTLPYALTYQAVVVETGQTLTVTANGSTRSARYATLQAVNSATQTIQITAALPATPSWTSVPAKQTIRLGVLGSAPTCGATS